MDTTCKKQLLKTHMTDARAHMHKQLPPPPGNILSEVRCSQNCIASLKLWWLSSIIDDPL